MTINCVFQPCNDCNTKQHCYKYWKDRAFNTAKYYEFTLEQLDKLIVENKRLKADVKILTDIMMAGRIDPRG